MSSADHSKSNAQLDRTRDIFAGLQRAALRTGSTSLMTGSARLGAFLASQDGASPSLQTLQQQRLQEQELQQQMQMQMQQQQQQQQEQEQLEQEQQQQQQGFADAADGYAYANNYSEGEGIVDETYFDGDAHDHNQGQGQSESQSQSQGDLTQFYASEPFQTLDGTVNVDATAAGENEGEGEGEVEGVELGLGLGPRRISGEQDTNAYALSEPFHGDSIGATADGQTMYEQEYEQDNALVAPQLGGVHPFASLPAVQEYTQSSPQAAIQSHQSPHATRQSPAFLQLPVEPMLQQGPYAQLQTQGQDPDQNQNQNQTQTQAHRPVEEELSGEMDVGNGLQPAAASGAVANATAAATATMTVAATAVTAATLAAASTTKSTPSSSITAGTGPSQMAAPRSSRMWVGTWQALKHVSIVAAFCIVLYVLVKLFVLQRKVHDLEARPLPPDDVTVRTLVAHTAQTKFEAAIQTAVSDATSKWKALHDAHEASTVALLSTHSSKVSQQLTQQLAEHARMHAATTLQAQERLAALERQISILQDEQTNLLATVDAVTETLLSGETSHPTNVSDADSASAPLDAHANANTNANAKAHANSKTTSKSKSVTTDERRYADADADADADAVAVAETESDAEDHAHSDRLRETDENENDAQNYASGERTTLDAQNDADDECIDALLAARTALSELADDAKSASNGEEADADKETNANVATQQQKRLRAKDKVETLISQSKTRPASPESRPHLAAAILAPTIHSDAKLKEETKTKANTNADAAMEMAVADADSSIEGAVAGTSTGKNLSVGSGGSVAVASVPDTRKKRVKKTKLTTREVRVEVVKNRTRTPAAKLHDELL